MEAPGGLRRIDIARKTGFSRRVINSHLKELFAHKEIQEWTGRIFWKTKWIVMQKWGMLELLLRHLKQSGVDPEEFLRNHYIGFFEDIPVWFPKAMETKEVEKSLEELRQQAEKEGLSLTEYIKKKLKAAHVFPLRAFIS